MTSHLMELTGFIHLNLRAHLRQVKRYLTLTFLLSLVAVEVELEKTQTKHKAVVVEVLVVFGLQSLQLVVEVH